MISPLIILFILIAVPLVLAIFGTLQVMRKLRQGKRTPLTSKLLRGPGESLRQVIDELVEELQDQITKLILTPVAPLTYCF